MARLALTYYANLTSANKLGADLASGRYSRIEDDEGKVIQTYAQGTAKLNNRLILWVQTGRGSFEVGKVSNVDLEQRYEWVYDPSKDHCATCLALDGIVLTARDWQRIPHEPKGRTLDCGGWNCGCSYQPTTRETTPFERIPTIARLWLRSYPEYKELAWAT